MQFFVFELNVKTAESVQYCLSGTSVHEVHVSPD